jgi:hypothetical protein
MRSSDSAFAAARSRKRRCDSDGTSASCYSAARLESAIRQHNSRAAEALRPGSHRPSGAPEHVVLDTVGAAPIPERAVMNAIDPAS